ncbi:MAG: ATP-binding protein [Thioalkalispiraceae bacterium]|jgi:anti-sigma regulatory factor (Ser/Thr protein kinase)
MTRTLLTKKFQAQTEQLHHLRRWVRVSAETAGLDENQVEKIVIGVNEACMNIIEHAYKKSPGEVIFEVRQEPGQVVFQLTDFAEPIDCDKIKPRALDDIRPGGLGVHFIQQVMDSVEYLPGGAGVGNVIKMVIKIK